MLFLFVVIVAVFVVVLVIIILLLLFVDIVVVFIVIGVVFVVIVVVFIVIVVRRSKVLLMIISLEIIKNFKQQQTYLFGFQKMGVVRITFSTYNKE